MPAARQAKRRRPRKASEPGLPRRVERLNDLLDLVLAAALRGRLLPGERRILKAYLEERRVERHEREAKERERRGPECPACLGPLPSLDLPRCPHCSVLLGVLRPRRR